jgi:hypothetical protein
MKAKKSYGTFKKGQQSPKMIPFREDYLPTYPLKSKQSTWNNTVGSVVSVSY